MTDGDGRWPAWVYAEGDDPDPRFTFANERTFLAWIRTALALVASGVAVRALDLPLSSTMERLLAMVLVTLGLACTLASWLRWARAERAMRRGDALPSMPVAALLSVALAGCAVALAIGMR